MSVGRLRKRTVIIFSSLVVVVIMALGAFIFRDELTFRYHKNRLLSAKARHWRLTTKGYSTWDHISEFLRGRPVSAEEVIATWKRHEQALVRRGFLSRQTFVSRNGPLPSRSTSPAYNQALARMEASCPWWSISRVDTNFVVTSCARGMTEWKGLAGDAGLRLKDETPESAQKTEKRCSRKRKNSHGLAIKGESGGGREKSKPARNSLLGVDLMESLFGDETRIEKLRGLELDDSETPDGGQPADQDGIE